MPSKYKGICKGCNKPYTGFGRFYCSPKCQPRTLTGGAVHPIKAEAHYNWKGDKAGYHAIHIWINKEWGKAVLCENTECVYPRKNAARSWVKKPRRYEWALKRGRTYTRHREDYYQLCKSCHAKYDYGLQVGSLA